MIPTNQSTVSHYIWTNERSPLSCWSWSRPSLHSEPPGQQHHWSGASQPRIEHSILYTAFLTTHQMASVVRWKVRDVADTSSLVSERHSSWHLFYFFHASKKYYRRPGRGRWVPLAVRRELASETSYESQTSSRTSSWPVWITFCFSLVGFVRQAEIVVMASSSYFRHLLNVLVQFLRARAISLRAIRNRKPANVSIPKKALSYLWFPQTVYVN